MKFKSHEELNDDELIEGFLDGEISYFNILYERYRRQLYSYLNGLVPGQHALVDDVFQQTWIKVINKLPKYKSQQKFLAWVMRISHNLAMDHFRKDRHIDKSVSAEDSQKLMADTSKEPWKGLDRKELDKAVKWALEQLNPELREVFILRQDELSFKEIAEIQNCSINTALSRMQYALKNLQNLLSEWRQGGT